MNITESLNNLNVIYQTSDFLSVIHLQPPSKHKTIDKLIPKRQYPNPIPIR